jgi:penicillin-binding protein A
VNRSIVRLFGVVILLFTILIVWTSRWTVFSATALNDNSLNRLQFYASLKVKRGSILADDGELLAKSVRAGGGTWTREYPTNGLFAQTVGYFNGLEHQLSGLESARNDYLDGKPNALTNLFGSLNGARPVGDDVHTTLDPKAQELAQQQLQNAVLAHHATSGSVVAIVPQTGAVKVLYSTPTYNDNDISHCRAPDCSTFFDALEGRYPPGSTFKLVTSTAALDTRKYTPTSPLINGHSPIVVSGAPLQNDNDDQYGYVNLSYALTYSINTVFAQVGENVGADAMQRYMERYGFYSVPPMDYPASEMSASGELFYKGECGNRSSIPKLVPVTSSCVDLGRTAIGQAHLAVTPMQMAMVVSAIANHGKLMEPRLTSQIVNQDGQVVYDATPQEYDQVMAPRYATQLTGMMEDVVEEGTGQAAIVEGLKVAGKTGTASTGLCYHEQPVDGNCPNGEPLDDAWFVGFAVNDPRIAVAVELSDIPNGYGGVYAAPIAARVIQTLLAEER